MNLTLGCTNKRYNGSMSIEIIENNKSLYLGKDLPNGPLEINCNIQWPTTLTIKLSNKGPDDTEMQNDNVINDKAIVLETLSINNFPLEVRVMEQLVNNTIYWGFNGTVDMIFTEKNPTRWMLKIKNAFYMNRLLWK